jgi:hypothetical protein
MFTRLSGSLPWPSAATAGSSAQTAAADRPTIFMKSRRSMVDFSSLSTATPSNALLQERDELGVADTLRETARGRGSAALRTVFPFVHGQDENIFVFVYPHDPPRSYRKVYGLLLSSANC